ncbi:hypothetical protein H6F76_22195 [Leptolyngbya sp. FACHB-321]|nr:hypothetical protein [Leptolyngbya sp. FACHB-321]MBD2037673.1 hypothetical protein [Leptolyngbya sp. FACHB-321]
MPYPTEVRYRRRCGTTWVGYIAHLSETCNDDDRPLSPSSRDRATPRF